MIEISTRDRRGTSISLTFNGLRPPFFGVSKTKCEHSKTNSIMLWVDPKCMLFNTSCFKNLLLTEGKVHIAQMHISFEILAPSFYSVFYHLRHGRLKRTKKHRGSKSGFWDPLADFEVEGCRNFRVRDMCNETAGFTTCCLSLWCRRYLWRVSSSRSCCEQFSNQKSFLIKGARKSLFFTLISSSLHVQFLHN